MVIFFVIIAMISGLVTSITQPETQLPSLFGCISVFLSNLSLAVILMFPICRYKEKIGITPKTDKILTHKDVEHLPNQVFAA